MRFFRQFAAEATSVTRICSGPDAVALLLFASLYLLAFQYCRVTFYRDPTSYFFDPTRAYTPEYSAIRRQEADTYIELLSRGPAYERKGHGFNTTLCVGIASVAREGARYFRTTVGSLLEGLTDEERVRIHLILFIAHTDPTAHPAYSETWLHNVPDQVLTYDLPREKLDYIRKLEHQKGLFREKALFDYTYLLKACSAVGAPYIAMLEDDVVAMDGWYHRTQRALHTAESTYGSRQGVVDFLYLRLFYTEGFLGWNSEEWPTYTIYSALAILGPALALLFLRHRFPILKRPISNHRLLTGCGLCIPLCIALFFAAGRVTVAPLTAGVNVMNDFGCCSQGFVFPHAKAEALVAWYASRGVGFVDMLTEEYADERRERRLALTPSVLQHVGRKSSKGDDFGKASKYRMSVAEKLWNFEFETMDRRRLRVEHEMVVSAGAPTGW